MRLRASTVPSIKSTEVERGEGGRRRDIVTRICRGPKALDAARRVLSNAGLEGLGLYSFRAIANGAVLDIRLDKVHCLASYACQA